MRMLLCPACGAKPSHTKQHQGDAAMGFKWRRVEIPHAKKPPGLHLTINGQPQREMKELVCDACDIAIPDGTPAVGISQWRAGEMTAWESEYTQ